MRVLHRVGQIARIAHVALTAGPATVLTARTAIRRWGAIQRTWELASLIALVRRRRPRVVLEIGTHTGGSMLCWTRAAAGEAHLVSIDMPTPAEGIGASGETDRRLRSAARPAQTLTLIRGDSHAPATRDAVVAALAGAQVDFLWIDGDHSDAGARADYADYAPLVRPGGLIAFHDILENPAIPGNQCHHLWRELRERHRVMEFIDQRFPGGVGAGIGVILV